MNVHTGSDRIAIVGERYTTKIARTNPIRALSYARYLRSSRDTKFLMDVWKDESVEDYQGMKWNLFRGIDANHRERRLSQTGDIVVPTVSILGGVVNIQPTTSDVDVEFDQIIRAFADNLVSPGSQIPRLGHMLEDAGNFGLHEGRVMFRDGGSFGLERVTSTPQGLESVSRALIQITNDNKDTL